MKYVIIPVLLFILILPVKAAELTPDGLIVGYDPTAQYKTSAKYIPEPVKRRMPLERYTTNTGAVTKQIIPVKTKSKDIELLLPDVLNWIRTGLKDMYSSLEAFHSKSLSILTILFQTVEPKPAAQKQRVRVIVPPKQSKKLAQLPTLAAVDGTLSRFIGDPYAKTIAQKIQDVYTWDRLWNPAYNPEHYLQCTTFVAMVYNLNGISLHGKVKGDAKEWIYLTDTFVVFENGQTSELPQVMDIVVWATNGGNHVGVVSEVTNNSVTIINANATQASYTYKLKVTDGFVTLTGATDWVPSHWMRIK